MTIPEPTPVITVATTVMDGQVVRWHHSVRDATNQRPVVSASRRGVQVHITYVTNVPQAWLHAAYDAHTAMALDRTADLSRLATHAPRGPLNGPLDPVQGGPSHG